MATSSEEAGEGYVLVVTPIKRSVAWHTHRCRSCVHSKLRPMKLEYAKVRGFHACPKCIDEDEGRWSRPGATKGSPYARIVRAIEDYFEVAE